MINANIYTGYRRYRTEIVTLAHKRDMEKTWGEKKNKKGATVWRIVANGKHSNLVEYIRVRIA